MMRATVLHFPTELQLPRAVEAAKHIRSAPIEIESPTMLLQQTSWLIMDEQEDAAESGATAASDSQTREDDCSYPVRTNRLLVSFLSEKSATC